MVLAEGVVDQPVAGETGLAAAGSADGESRPRVRFASTDQVEPSAAEDSSGLEHAAADGASALASELAGDIEKGGDGQQLQAAGAGATGQFSEALEEDGSVHIDRCPPEVQPYLRSLDTAGRGVIQARSCCARTHARASPVLTQLMCPLQITDIPEMGFAGDLSLGFVMEAAQAPAPAETAALPAVPEGAMSGEQALNVSDSALQRDAARRADARTGSHRRLIASRTRSIRRFGGTGCVWRPLAIARFAAGSSNRPRVRSGHPRHAQPARGHWHAYAGHPGRARRLPADAADADG